MRGQMTSAMKTTCTASGTITSPDDIIFWDGACHASYWYMPTSTDRGELPFPRYGSTGHIRFIQHGRTKARSVFTSSLLSKIEETKWTRYYSKAPSPAANHAHHQRILQYTMNTQQHSLFAAKHVLTLQSMSSQKATWGSCLPILLDIAPFALNSRAAKICFGFDTGTVKAACETPTARH